MNKMLLLTHCWCLIFLFILQEAQDAQIMRIYLSFSFLFPLSLFPPKAQDPADIPLTLFSNTFWQSHHKGQGCSFLKSKTHSQYKDCKLQPMFHLRHRAFPGVRMGSQKVQLFTAKLKNEKDWERRGLPPPPPPNTHIHLSPLCLPPRPTSMQTVPHAHRKWSRRGSRRSMHTRKGRREGKGGGCLHRVWSSP